MSPYRLQALARRHLPAVLGLVTLLALALAPGGLRPALAAGAPPQLTLLGSDVGAPIALSGDTAAARNGSGQGTGIVVFERRGSAWSRQAVITRPDHRQGGEFGASLALSGDILAVGTLQSVYIFGHSGHGWIPEARIDAPPQPANPGGSFGAALALDGDVLIVGTPDYFFPHASGLAYVYGRDASGRWNLEGTLDRGADFPAYGSAVAVTADTTFVSGELLDFVDVYRRVGRRWRFAGQLTGGADGNQGLEFGYALAASGATLAVGGDGQDLTVFASSRSGWVEQDVLPAPHPLAHFGLSLAVDGDVIVAGDDVFDEAYVYLRDHDAWDLAALLVPPAQAPRAFGQAVAVSGRTALVTSFGARPPHTGYLWVVDGLGEP